MNKITFTGRLAADCETRFTPAGDAIANFRVASDVGFGDKKSTNWFACAIFGKRGEALAPYLKKGQQVTVFGSLTLREWTDNNGAKKLSPDIRVDEIELQGGKQQQDDSAQEAQHRQRPQPANKREAQDKMRPQPSAEDFQDSDIPF